MNRFVSLVAALGCLTSGCATVGPNYRPATVNVSPSWLEFEDPKSRGDLTRRAPLVEGGLRRTRCSTNSSTMRSPAT